MIFKFEPLLTSRDNVISVDGAFDAKLQLSHWVGNKSPSELKAPTTTEMAFKLIEHPEKEKYLNGIDVVSNNHYDADGVISSFTLLFPEEAKKYKSSLIYIARTGDFAEFTTEDAFNANTVIESFVNEEKSLLKNILSQGNYPKAMQIIYQTVFQLLPEIVKNIDKYEKYWREEFNYYSKSEESFLTKNSVFSNYGDCYLSVIESDFILHPVAKFKHADFDVVLSAVKNEEKHLYQIEYKYRTWFDTGEEKTIKRKNFEPLAKKLNQIEMNSEGAWKIIGRDPVYDWNYSLIFSDKNYNPLLSSLSVFEVENELFEFLAQ